MVLSLVDTAAGTLAGIVAAVAVLLLPGFLPLHRTSLTGPPLTAVTLLMIGVMVHAPRFSVAYGMLAATAAVFIDPAGAGLVIAAVAWAWLVVGARRGDRLTRIGLALLPLLLASGLALRAGSAWPTTLHFGWHGDLDEGLHAAGIVFGDQLAPTLTAAIRWFAIADLTLLLIALGVVTWRRTGASPRADTVPGRLLPALLVTALGLSVGLVVTWLALPRTPLPTLDDLFPMLGILVVATVTSIALLWPRWPRWGKVAVLVLVIGWAQAALRS
ncbi:MAG TPA: hypothetical protein VFN22_08005 [Gemmatimonadales bacterium]|nr:hypothetical protein [Gemmatimonadales bacterium]